MTTQRLITPRLIMLCLSVLLMLQLSACSEPTNQHVPISQPQSHNPNNTSIPSSDVPNTPPIAKPNSSQNSPQRRPVYNQAYQENYDADSLKYILKTARNAYILIDPFQLKVDVTRSIQTIKTNSNEVGCYISAGTGENWRSDFQQMRPYLVKKQWGEWQGEYFVHSTTTGILDIMQTRVDKMKAWGCDWVEFDNMDWASDDDYREDYGFVVTLQESIDYMQSLCGYVKQNGMKCMAKNTVDHHANFDGVLYESYDDEKNWWGQGGTEQFLAAGKLVIINHYNESQCDRVYADYKRIYNDQISFICEDKNKHLYRHYNQ